MKIQLQRSILATVVITALFIATRTLGVNLPWSALLTGLIVILLLTGLNAAKASHRTRNDNHP